MSEQDMPQQQGGPPEAAPPTTEPTTTEPGTTEPPTAEHSTGIVAELEDKWRRALADLDNLRKRHARERPGELAAERVRVARAWLPVLDNLELALAHADPDDPIAQGVKAVRDQAVEVLRGLGYPRNDETGVPFDPALHEVVTMVDAPDTAPNTVVQVIRPGYGEPGRQLRPAAVAVSRKQE